MQKEEAGPLEVLVVASWYPAFDDESRGRFVADQAAALLASGDVRPSVVSFEPVVLAGPAHARRGLTKLVAGDAWAALAGGASPFSTCGWSGAPGVPVARLPIPDDRTSAGRPDRHASARAGALLALLAGRTAGTGWRLIHAHTGYPDGAAALADARLLGCPLIVTEHASFLARILAQPDQRRRYEETVAAAARVIAVSERLAAELRAALPGIAGKLVVIPNTVDIAAFRPAPLAGRTPDELLYVGYRVEGKGIATLLAAFARVRGARPTVTLRLIGRSPDEEIEAGWQRLAVGLGIADAVRFDPPARREEVADAMAQASLFVHASRRETFGIVAVEALASGLPVVATDSGGVTEILGPEPGLGGALAPVDDPEALAAAILATLERREAFDPVTLRASVEQRYGAASVAARIVALYREVLAETPPAVPSVVVGSITRRPAVGASPRLVLGLDRAHAAERLAALPDALLAELILITSATPTRVGLPAAIGRVVEVELLSPPEFGSRAPGARSPRLLRLLRLLADPFGALARWRAWRAWSAAAAREGRSGVERALGDSSGLVVPIEGIDHLALRGPLADGRARLAPGGLRWLADRWAAERVEA